MLEPQPGPNEPFVASLFRAHVFGLIEEGARQLGVAVDNVPLHDQLAREMMLGARPGLVCARCGMAMSEVLLSSFSLKLSGWMPSVVACVNRPTSVLCYRRSGRNELGPTLYDALETLRADEGFVQEQVMMSQQLSQYRECFALL